jgi:uncharacterized membrane protein
MRSVYRVFLRGLLAVLPVAVTVYLVFWLATTFESLFQPVLTRLLPGNDYVPGMGVVMGLGTVFVVGLMLQAWFLRRLWQWFEKLLDRMPLVRQVYRALKELVDYLGGEEQPGGSTVVMLRYGDPPMRLLGLVTRDAVDYGPQEAEEPLVAVFLPWSYQVGGFTVYVPRASLDEIDLTRDQALRLAITAGVSAEPHTGPGKRARHATQDGGATPS